MGETGSETLSADRETTVFFSYSRVNLDAAKPIIDLLEREGIAVWWDGMLGAGVKYVEQTEHALETARAVVVAWSEQSVSSHWVRDEAQSGRDSNRLVPISLDGSLPPLGFRQFQVLDFSQWNGDEQAPIAVELLRAVRALHDGDVPHHAAPVFSPPKASRRQTLGLIGLGGTALVAGGAGLAWLMSDDGPATGDNSIAVLPFLEDGADEAQTYIAAGLASELRSILARNPALSIVARSSSEVVAERGLDAVAAARELGVAYIVEGSAQTIDGMVRVSSDLIDGRTGLGRWSQTFNQPVDNLMALQTELAEQISTALSLEVSQSSENLQLGQASVPAAYDAYLRGWAAYEGGQSQESLTAALGHFENAAQLDPGFAGARSGAATAHLAMGHGSSTSAAARAHYEQAVASARQAVELGPDLAEAHSVLAQTLFEAMNNIAAAREPYQRSLQSGAGSAPVLARYAEYEALTGRDNQALDPARRATRLDPLNPLMFKSLALVHYSARRWDEAIEQHRAALALNPDVSGSHAWIGQALLQLGDAQGAVAECEQEPSRLLGKTCLAIAHDARGDRVAAETAMAELQDRYGDAAAYQYAQVYAQWGDIEQAMEQLALANRLGDAGLGYLGMDPMLDPVRERDDFIRLQAQLGFR